MLNAIVGIEIEITRIVAIRKVTLRTGKNAIVSVPAEELGKRVHRGSPAQC